MRLAFIFVCFFFIIFYAITVVPTFFPFAPLHPAPPLPQAIPTPLSLSMGHTYTFFGLGVMNSFSWLFFCIFSFGFLIYFFK